jgi:hypothetical protein
MEKKRTKLESKSPAETKEKKDSITTMNSELSE